MVAERGSAILLLDAIDEIDAHGEGLSFLPKKLPTGVSVLVTGRRGAAEKEFRKVHPSTDELALQSLGREEIPGVTGVPDDSEAGRGFNDRVFEKGDGWALFVSEVASRIRRKGGDYSSVSVGDWAEVLYEQAEAWTAPPS
jgi:hypothetical protein